MIYCTPGAHAFVQGGPRPLAPEINTTPLYTSLNRKSENGVGAQRKKKLEIYEIFHFLNLSEKLEN